MRRNMWTRGILESGKAVTLVTVQFILYSVMCYIALYSVRCYISYEQEVIRSNLRNLRGPSFFQYEIVSLQHMFIVWRMFGVCTSKSLQQHFLLLNKINYIRVKSNVEGLTLLINIISILRIYRVMYGRDTSGWMQSYSKTFRR